MACHESMVIMARLDKGGQMAASEFLVIIILILVCVAEGWYIAKHKVDSNIYQAGSNPKVTEFSPHPSFGGCVRESLVESWGGGNSVITNKIKH